MRYVEAGGVRLSAIGLGTWQFGSIDWGYGRDYAATTARDITHRALDLGINLFDTAELYGFGRSERILGEALGDRRSEAFIATKITPVFPIAPVVEQRARASLRRLKTDRIDLYQVHAPNPVVPDGPTMTGMRRLMDADLVRHAGVSNYGLDRWRRADAALGEPVLSNQVSFSLVERAPERDLVPFARDNGRIVIAYSPLAQGLLGGRYDPDNRPTGVVRRMNPLFLPENLERASGLVQTLRDVAAAHECTPAQVALAWVIARPNVVAIPGASSVEQVESNAAAADIELTDEEDRRLCDEAERFEPVGGVATARGRAESLVEVVRSRFGRG
jgi:aryl-alcohol dehydrogenase-like predicted oxidoreductase